MPCLTARAPPQPDNKYSGIRKQSSHWETRIRYKDKLYSMGFYASVEAAALAWDITAASLRRCRKLNFPEVSFADLEQQLDALKCVISQVPGNEQIAHMPYPPPAAHVAGAADGLALEPPPGTAPPGGGMAVPKDEYGMAVDGGIAPPPPQGDAPAAGGDAQMGVPVPVPEQQMGVPVPSPAGDAAFEEAQREAARAQEASGVPAPVEEQAAPDVEMQQQEDGGQGQAVAEQGAVADCGVPAAPAGEPVAQPDHDAMVEQAMAAVREQAVEQAQAEEDACAAQAVDEAAKATEAEQAAQVQQAEEQRAALEKEQQAVEAEQAAETFQAALDAAERAEAVRVEAERAAQAQAEAERAAQAQQAADNFQAALDAAVRAEAAEREANGAPSGGAAGADGGAPAQG
jgi:hypothetical protein